MQCHLVRAYLLRIRPEVQRYARSHVVVIITIAAIMRRSQLIRVSRVRQFTADFEVFREQL
jgi:hypothetical protein